MLGTPYRDHLQGTLYWGPLLVTPYQGLPSGYPYMGPYTGDSNR